MPGNEDLVTTSERHSPPSANVLEAPKAAEKTTLLHAFFHWANTKPATVFLTQPLANGQTIDITWAQASDAVRRMAAHLASLELPERSSIGLLGKNTAHWILADLAIWTAGHVTVPLYPTLSVENFAYILEQAEVQLLFVGRLDASAWNSMQPGIPTGLPLVGLPFSAASEAPTWDSIAARVEPLEHVPEPALDSLATIIYTSGTGGEPKGVMHTFRTMIAPSLTAALLWPLDEHERFLSYLPLAHVAERGLIEALALYHGGRIFFVDSLDTFATDLKRARPTLFFSVPRLWTKFYTAVNEKLPPHRQRLLFKIPFVSQAVKKRILEELGLDHTRVAITGSAPLPEAIVRWYRELGLELVEGYGLSENFGASHIGTKGTVRPGYVGHPIPGVECRLDEDGEILMKGPSLMPGYYKMPELSAQSVTADGFLRTGDRGELDPEGRLKITGRIKEPFKTSKGKYVAPAPIEQRFSSFTKLEAVCVTGEAEPQPFALLMLTAEAMKQADSDKSARAALSREIETVLSRVNESLEDHERLDYAVVVKDAWTIESGFLTPTMKIKRNAIERRYLENAEAWRSSGKRVIWET